MKVLITGANGFLGSWLTKRLLAEGHHVSALVRKNSDLSELDDLMPNFVYGDVTDLESLKINFRNQDTVFHLAGVIAYKKSQRSLMDRVNVQGTSYVVQACHELQIPQLIHLSSVVAVGAEKNPVVMNESSPYTIGPLNLGYFETKRKAEKIVMAAVNENKIRAVCVNPSQIYGFGDARKGSRKNQIKAAKGRLPFYTSGGVNVVPVEDVIEGILLAWKKGKNGERYILSSENMLIKDVFQRISKLAGAKPPRFEIPAFALHGLGILDDLLANFDQTVGFSRENAYTATLFHWFDCAKAKTELGFLPTSADVALENSVRWMKDHKYI